MIDITLVEIKSLQLQPDLGLLALQVAIHETLEMAFTYLCASVSSALKWKEIILSTSLGWCKD